MSLPFTSAESTPSFFSLYTWLPVILFPCSSCSPEPNWRTWPLSSSPQVFKRFFPLPFRSLTKNERSPPTLTFQVDQIASIRCPPCTSGSRRYARSLGFHINVRAALTVSNNIYHSDSTERMCLIHEEYWRLKRNQNLPVKLTSYDHLR
jgi:hypothetical protein